MAPMDERYERGLDAYASQFGIPREDVPAWFEERLGERFGTEAVNAAGGAWIDDCLSLRDRSLVVIAALVAQGGLEGVSHRSETRAEDAKLLDEHVSDVHRRVIAAGGAGADDRPARCSELE